MALQVAILSCGCFSGSDPLGCDGFCDALNKPRIPSLSWVNHINSQEPVVNILSDVGSVGPLSLNPHIHRK